MRIFGNLLISGLFLVIASSQAMAQSVQLPNKEVSVKNVNGSAVFSGASVVGLSGQPALPSYIVSFLLPPNADLSTVSVTLDYPAYQDLAGQYDVVPNPPIRHDDGTIEWPKGPNIVLGKDMTIYGNSAFFPGDFKGNVSCGPMRQYNLVHIRIYPYLYNPVTKTLRKLSAGTLKVSVSSSSAASRMAREEWVEKMFMETVANPDAVNSYGQAPASTSINTVAAPSSVTMAAPAPLAAAAALQPPAFGWVAGYGYLIVAATYIWNNSVGLNNYKQHLTNLGAIVTTFDDTQINPTGNMNAKFQAANIRSGILTWYNNCVNSGISPKYVLFVGNPDTADVDASGNPITGHVPMYVWQTSWGQRVPTDFYYADLSTTWDSDCSAWLCVGRIPVYITATHNDIGNLDAYISKMYNYSMALSDTGVEWRRNVLVEAEALGFGDANNENYQRLEDVVSPLISVGWNCTRFYNSYVQYAGASYFLLPGVVNMNPLPEHAYCSPTNFANAWTSETPSIIVWNSHGGPDGVCGVISTNVNAPEYTFPLLNNSHPAMVVSASCHTSDPTNENNLGTRTLFANAISYIGATVDASGGDDAWRYFSYNMAIKGLCAANAWNLLRVNDQDPPNCIWFNLYGCPEAALNLPNVSPVTVPQSFGVRAISSSQIQLSWDVNSNAATYTIQRSTDFSVKRSGFSTIATVPNGSTATSYLDGNLTPGTRYKYRISYYPNGSSDPSGYSIIDSACTWNSDNTKPAPDQSPTLYTPIAGSNCATITWSSVTGASWYSVKRSISSKGPFVTIVTLYKTTSFLDSNLMNSTTYYYTVSAVNGYGQGPNSALVSVTPATNLSAPTLNGVSANGPYSAHCDFTSSVHNETGFIIQDALKFPDGTYDYYKDSDYPRRRYTSDNSTGLPTNSIYGIRVCAANETTYLGSNNIDFYLPASQANPITIQPTALTASTLGPSQVTLNWQFTGSGTCDYTQVYFKAVGYGWQSTNVAYPGSSAAVTINPNTNIQVFIRTVKNKLSSEPDGTYSCSDFIAISSIAPYEAENSALSGGAAKNTNHTGYSGTGFVDGFYNSSTAQVLFTVNAPFAGSYDVKLHYSAGNGTSTNTSLSVNGTYIKNITCAGTGNWNAWADETETITLSAGSNTIAYKAASSSGSSINLDYITLTNRSAMPPPPNTPSNIAATAASSTQINLSWTDNSNNEQGFNIFQGLGSKGPFNQIASVGANATSYANTGLTAGTTYWYLVTSYNVVGNSNYSNMVSATTPATTKYTITASAGSGGSISPIGNVTVNSGASQTFTITANSGYAVTSVTVDGVNQGAFPSYTFNNVTANHTIAVAFISVPVMYAITALASANGSISPSGTVLVNSGSSQTFTITPSSGYAVSAVTVDGTSQGTITSYTFTNVTANHTISATFVSAPVQYTISASAGANGTISPSGSVKVNSGASQTFTITPNSGYLVSALTVDGSNKGALSTYTFTNVTAAHTISATFALQVTTYEAENAALAGTAAKNTNHAGYSGTGFVDGFYNSTTAKVTFTVNVPTAGSYKVTLRYSAGNGTSSNTGLYVNSTTKLKNISCAGTANWDTWGNEQETLTLNAGNNTIAYKAETSSGSCSNLDYVTVSK